MTSNITINGIIRQKVDEQSIKTKNKSELKIPETHIDPLMYFRIQFLKNGLEYDIGYLSSQYLEMDTESRIPYFPKFLGREYGGCAAGRPFEDLSQILIGNTDSATISDDIRRTISDYITGIYVEQKWWFNDFESLENKNSSGKNYFEWKLQQMDAEKNNSKMF